MRKGDNMGLKLNRNAWHRKLQKYVLGLGTSRYDDMPNLCPYFWLTIFCIVALVPKWVGSKVIKLFNKIVSPIDRLVAHFDNWYYSSCSPDLVMWWYDKSYSKYLKWCSHNKLDRYAREKMEQEFYARQKYKRDAQAKKEADRRKRMNKIAYYTSKAAPVFLGAVGLFASWLIYLIVGAIAANWVNFLTLAIFVIGVVILLLIGIAIAFLLKDLSKKYMPPSITKKITIFEEIFEFIRMYIKNTKDNYCPSVDWE